MDLQGAGPTFEDLSIDDELTQLERVVRYSGSSIALQRLVHVKMLAETVAAVGFEQTVKFVVPLLAPLAADQEQVVRQHLGEQLDEIARLCKAMGKEAGYRLIIETVLPTLTKLLGDSQAEVRQAAGESLVGVAGLMKPMDLGQHVLTIVLQLAHDDEQEELRMTAAALLNDLAESLGNDLCKQFVTPEMVSLSEDPVFRVRKATALNLHKICKVVGEAGIQRLLPAYVRLTKDDVYRVRKACTEALVEMSKAVGPEVSLRELQPVFINLASDSSKLVRTGALQHLGRLISTLPGEAVTEDLVQYFTATAVESMGDPVADAELRLYCAFSFPAVVITIGPDRWHELRDSFGVLLRDPSWSVRKTLSHSLHEVAKVLKADDVEDDLVPAMEAFLRDMEDVRLGVIRHLAEFFEQMSPDRREKHLNVLVEILQTTSPFNWRLREILAQQLPRLAPLLSLDSVFFAVVPVAFGLLNDPVAVVRERTFEVVAPLLQLAGAHSGARQASMVSRVRELAHAHTYQARQMYVHICHSMALVGSPTDRRLFVQEFVPSLAELARDSVVNVRITMSRTLSKSPDWMMELPDIRRAIHHLVSDSNPDVRHFVSCLPPILGSELSQEDKMPWVDSSSVLSDESVLTQWSVSTQRSMLSVGDFPAVKDVNSPNRSLKTGRQRSSSMESGGGESGNSTTSSEGDALNRQSSRRLPLPSGWGLGGGGGGGTSPASSPLTIPSILVAAGKGGASLHRVPHADEVGGSLVEENVGASSGVGDSSTPATAATAAFAVAASKVDGVTGVQAVGAREDVIVEAVETGESSNGKTDDQIASVPTSFDVGGSAGAEAMAVQQEQDKKETTAAVSEETSLPEEGNPGGDSGTDGSTSASVAAVDQSSLSRMHPRGVEKTAEVKSPQNEKDETEAEAAGVLIPPIVPVPPVDPAALSSKMEELTLGDEAGVVPEVNREGPASPVNAPPLTTTPVRRAGPFGLGALLSKIGGGSGSGGRPFEERSPVWTGAEEGEEDENANVAGDTAVVTEAAAHDGPRNLTPPPWDNETPQEASDVAVANVGVGGGGGDVVVSGVAMATREAALAGSPNPAEDSMPGKIASADGVVAAPSSAVAAGTSDAKEDVKQTGNLMVDAAEHSGTADDGEEGRRQQPLRADGDAKLDDAPAVETATVVEGKIDGELLVGTEGSLLPPASAAAVAAAAGSDSDISSGPAHNAPEVANEVSRKPTIGGADGSGIFTALPDSMAVSASAGGGASDDDRSAAGVPSLSIAMSGGAADPEKRGEIFVRGMSPGATEETPTATASPDDGRAAGVGNLERDAEIVVGRRTDGSGVDNSDSAGAQGERKRGEAGGETGGAGARLVVASPTEASHGTKQSESTRA